VHMRRDVYEYISVASILIYLCGQYSDISVCLHASPLSVSSMCVCVHTSVLSVSVDREHRRMRRRALLSVYVYVDTSLRSVSMYIRLAS
jgi:hypothetical protein